MKPNHRPSGVLRIRDRSEAPRGIGIASILPAVCERAIMHLQDSFFCTVWDATKHRVRPSSCQWLSRVHFPAWITFWVTPPSSSACGT